MATITSAQSGNANEGATWVGGVAPGAGDQVLIRSGHTITIPASTTVTWGLSAAHATTDAAVTAGTLAVDAVDAAGAASATSTGRIIIYGTLRYRGPIRLADGGITIYAGGALEHDSSAAADPTNTNYQIQLGRSANQTNSVLTFAGVPGSRAYWRKATGSGNAGALHGGAVGLQSDYYTTSGTNGAAGGGRISAAWGHLSDIGATATEAVFCVLNGATNKTFALRDTIVTGCREIHIAQDIGPTNTVALERSSILAPLNTIALRIFENSTAATRTAGELLIEDCVFDGTVDHVYARDFTVRRSAFAGTATSAPFTTNSVGARFTLVEDCFFFNRWTNNAAASAFLNGTVNRIISLRKNFSGDDDHFRQPANAAMGSAWDGAIFEYEGTVAASDCLVIQGDPATLTEHTFRNLLGLPNAGGVAPGSLVTVVGTAGVAMNNHRVSVEKSTLMGGDAAAAVLATEATLGCAGLVQALRSNIVHRNASGLGCVQLEAILGGAFGAGTILGADYNARYNLSNDGYGSPDLAYDTPTPPGTNDITGDPQFYDQTRCMLTWAQTVEPTVTTWDDIWTEIAKKNDDSGYNSGFDWWVDDDGAYDWIRAGFAPRNAAYATAGHDGGVVGAVPMYVPIPSQLYLATGPGNAEEDGVFGTQPVVQIRDYFDTLCTSATNAVTAEILSGTGTLLGTTTVNAVAGVATFTNLRLDTPGTFRLRFTATGLVAVNSAEFTVRYPGTGPLTFTVVDLAGDPVSGRTVTVESSNTAIATVSSATDLGSGQYQVTVTAVAPGSCTITATCDGVTSSVATITVLAAP